MAIQIRHTPSDSHTHEPYIRLLTPSRCLSSSPFSRIPNTNSSHAPLTISLSIPSNTPNQHTKQKEETETTPTQRHPFQDITTKTKNITAPPKTRKRLRIRPTLIHPFPLEPREQPPNSPPRKRRRITPQFLGPTPQSSLQAAQELSQYWQSTTISHSEHQQPKDYAKIDQVEEVSEEWQYFGVEDDFSQPSWGNTKSDVSNRTRGEPRFPFWLKNDDDEAESDDSGVSINSAPDGRGNLRRCLYRRKMIPVTNSLGSSKKLDLRIDSNSCEKEEEQSRDAMSMYEDSNSIVLKKKEDVSSTKKSKSNPKKITDFFSPVLRTKQIV